MTILFVDNDTLERLASALPRLQSEAQYNAKKEPQGDPEALARYIEKYTKAKFPFFMEAPYNVDLHGPYKGREIVEGNGFFIYCHSTSGQKDQPVHSIAIDQLQLGDVLDKETGELVPGAVDARVKCNCQDRVCRKKDDQLIGWEIDSCKHVSMLVADAIFLHAGVSIIHHNLTLRQEETA